MLSEAEVYSNPLTGQRVSVCSSCANELGVTRKMPNAIQGKERMGAEQFDASPWHENIVKTMEDGHD